MNTTGIEPVPRLWDHARPHGQRAPGELGVHDAARVPPSDSYSDQGPYPSLPFDTLSGRCYSVRALRSNARDAPL
ncbi:hypothetical protein GCM10009548_01580 [Streptomyces malaysiensis subsp. malaysiensis]